MAAQNSPASALEPIPAYKKPYPPKKSRKPPALKQEVIVRRIAQQNKSQISRELGISKNTVTAILEESNTDRLVESGRLQVAGLIPESIRVVKHRLEKNSETAAFEVLKGIGVLGKDVKQGKAPDASLMVNIQQLMGNVTVQSQATQQDTQTKPIEAEVLSSSTESTPSSTTQCNNSTQKA